MLRLELVPPALVGKLDPRTLADVLRYRAETQPDDLVLTFLADGDKETVRLSYAELDRRARRVAALLQRHEVRGKAVILLFQPTPEFLVGFLACLYAGAMGVPLYPPDMKRLSRTAPRFLAIVEDCRADVVLTTRQMRELGSAAVEFAPQLARRTWLAVDEGPAGGHEEWRDPGCSIEDVAFLQYTSGSTGDPKGVIVTHRSLLYNFHILAEVFGSRAGESTVTWLPNYHDMGLIEGWLRPIWSGCHGHTMPPTAFLKNPAAWVQAISRYRAGVSGAPNFAYDLCAARITDEELAALDLSCWHTAFCGAEPVRPDTMERFHRRFAPAGLRREALSPGYGLAEAGLVVCCDGQASPFVAYPIRRAALAAGRIEPCPATEPGAQLAVGVGKPQLEALIVDPEARVPCPEGRVGELWLAGPSIASGYWGRPDETRATFEARLATGAGPYLRTGDLAFLRADGELFITGRRKDLVIIAGRNHYPQDIEKTVEGSAPAHLRPGCNAAFSVDVRDEERLVVVQEVQRGHEVGAPDPAGLIRAMRAAVAEEHGIDPHAIVLIKAGSITKTSSGKIQRHACREAFLKAGLEAVHAWCADDDAPRGEAPGDAVDDSPAAALRDVVRAVLAARLRVPVARIDDSRPFAEYGLDSRAAVSLAGELEARVGRALDASVLFDHPTVDRLVRFLAGAQTAEADASSSPSPLTAGEPIAIVGMACRFPGAESLSAFWDLLAGGRDAVGEVPASRWSAEALYDADPNAPGRVCSKYGGFLRDIDQFDPAAFDITAREAARMDPQQRLLLEVAAEALDNAGISRPTCAGSETGVFVGIASFDYARHLFRDRRAVDAYGGTGAALSIAANRISYQFDLRGPSVAVDTACSSSLVALHTAMNSLRRGECSTALVGGVNALLSPEVSIVFTRAGVLSPGGRCKAFDDAADGIVRAEGAGMVVLKPLCRARADGDHVWAVLLGGAVNSNGRSNGLMAPNGTAQRALIAAACRHAGVAPACVQYVEAHGTGTKLGDPIEVEAIGSVLAAGRPADQPCRIGSVKTNLGHLEAAAGIAGVIKVALSLHHRALVPSLHFREPNARIPFDRLR